MTWEKFWSIIDRIRAKADMQDEAFVKQFLYTELINLPQDELLGFDCAWKTLQSDLFANLPQIKAERMPQDFSAVLPKLWRKRQAWDTERTKRPPYRGEER